MPSGGIYAVPIIQPMNIPRKESVPRNLPWEGGPTDPALDGVADDVGHLGDIGDVARRGTLQVAVASTGDVQGHAVVGKLRDLVVGREGVLDERMPVGQIMGWVGRDVRLDGAGVHGVCVPTGDVTGFRAGQRLC
jgi:hypothetical protein